MSYRDDSSTFVDRHDNPTAQRIIVPIITLNQIVASSDVKVVASGGFDSLSAKHAFAVEASESGRPFEVLHVGDYDPSGGSMFIGLKEDVTAFARNLGGSVTFTRVAVTSAQIAEYRLPTAPPKATDRRAFHGMACQAEALP